jgi:hypothetical protein
MYNRLSMARFLVLDAGVDIISSQHRLDLTQYHIHDWYVIAMRSVSVSVIACITAL